MAIAANVVLYKEENEESDRRSIEVEIVKYFPTPNSHFGHNGFNARYCTQFTPAI